MSCARACRLAQFSRAAWYRKSTARDQTALRLRIRDLAHARPRFGYLRIWVLLRREGWAVNRKRVRRWYRFEGLQLRMRVRRRKHIALHRGPAPVPIGPSERWSMDFVHDTLSEGRPYRILTVVDNWSRSSPVLEAGFRMSGEIVGRVLDRVLGDEAREPRGRRELVDQPLGHAAVQGADGFAVLQDRVANIFASGAPGAVTGASSRPTSRPAAWTLRSAARPRGTARASQRPRSA